MLHLLFKKFNLKQKSFFFFLITKETQVQQVSKPHLLWLSNDITAEPAVGFPGVPRAVLEPEGNFESSAI